MISEAICNEVLMRNCAERHRFIPKSVRNTTQNLVTICDCCFKQIFFRFRRNNKSSHYIHRNVSFAFYGFVTFSCGIYAVPLGLNCRQCCYIPHRISTSFESFLYRHNSNLYISLTDTKNKQETDCRKAYCKISKCTYEETFSSIKSLLSQKCVDLNEL